MNENEKLINNNSSKKVDQLKDFYKNLNLFYVALSIGLFLSLINLILAIVVSVNFTSYASNYIGGFSIISLIIFAYGLWAVKKYSYAFEKEANTEDLEKM